MNKKIAVKYGAISGLLIVSSWFIGYMLSGGETHFEGGEVVGYGVMLLALTAVFMGVKSKRDDSDNPTFTFKEGFLTGLGIVIVASLIYVIGWLIYMPTFAPDFIDKYQTSQIELVQNSELSPEEKTNQINEVRESIENYKKPHVMVAYTFIEIFPVGLIVALITALILRRKP
ncbi:MAG: DUF4199 domain-containing protein [Cyclobacteriaceae bacterium]